MLALGPLYDGLKVAAQSQESAATVGTKVGHCQRSEDVSGRSKPQMEEGWKPKKRSIIAGLITSRLTNRNHRHAKQDGQDK